MSLPLKEIYNPDFWRERIQQAPVNAFHHSVFVCPTDRWNRIEDKHRQILRREVKPNYTILDAGCGWGRLLDLMPPFWTGGYLGVDISPDFINLARIQYKNRRFVLGNLSKLDILSNGEMDLGILISIRPMIKRNMGDEEWGRVETELKRVCKKLLYLEYDETDEGSLEAC
jgi:ubiquinone/menaquinone biosynthesis C-methylase UbiE